LRCIGLRTDMKAKVFEWIDTGFEVPGSILGSEEAAYLIDRGLNLPGIAPGRSRKSSVNHLAVHPAMPTATLN